MNVNFASSQALVKASSEVSADDLISAIEKAGYKAFLCDDSHNVDEVDKRKKETKYWLKKFVWALILSSPMLIFMLYDFFP